MSNKKSNLGLYVLLGGVLLSSGIGIAGAIFYNKRKRQNEYDDLILFINKNKTKQSEAEEQGGGFDRNLYKKNPKCVTITPAQAKEYATKIYNAKKSWYGNDDELAVESVMRNIKTKCDLSRVADSFYGLYRKLDLLTFLKSFLDETEMENIIYKYSNNLK